MLSKLSALLVLTLSSRLFGQSEVPPQEGEHAPAHAADQHSPSEAIPSESVDTPPKTDITPPKSPVSEPSEDKILPENPAPKAPTETLAPAPEPAATGDSTTELKTPSNLDEKAAREVKTLPAVKSKTTHTGRTSLKARVGPLPAKSESAPGQDTPVAPEFTPIMPASTPAAVSNPAAAPAAAPQAPAAQAPAAIKPTAGMNRIPLETPPTTPPRVVPANLSPSSESLSLVREAPDDDKPEPKSPNVKAADLNLTPEQTKTIVEIRRNSTLEREKILKAELKTAQRDLNLAMSGTVPADEVKTKFDLVQAKYQELQRLKFQRTIKIRDVLTPEQRRKFQAGSK